MKISKENIDELVLCEKCLCWKGKYKDLEMEIWDDNYVEQKYTIVCFCECISCETCGEDKRPKPGTFFWSLSRKSFSYISGLEWDFKCICCGEDYDFVNPEMF